MFRRPVPPCPIVPALAALLHVAGAAATDFPVDCANAPNSLDANIESAIAAAQLGTPSRVVLSAGNCSAASAHTMNAAGSLAIVGAGQASTSISLNGAPRLLLVQPASGSADLTLREVGILFSQVSAIGLVNATLYANGVLFQQNAGTSGGAIGASSAALTIRRSRFVSNGAQDGGAIAIDATSTLDMEDSSFVGNTATHSGGAIYTNGPANIRNSLIVGGNASSAGGAVLVGSNAEIRNSTFTASGSPDGDVLNVLAGGALLLANVTIYDSGSPRSAISSASSALTFTNTLISGSCAGLTASPAGKGNLESPGNTCMLGPGNQVGVSDINVKLGGVANNGGPTNTMLPASGSLMIDHGDKDSCEAIDQRRVLRDVASCDVGAVEVGATTTDPIFVDGLGG